MHIASRRRRKNISVSYKKVMRWFRVMKKEAEEEEEEEVVVERNKQK